MIPGARPASILIGGGGVLALGTSLFLDLRFATGANPMGELVVPLWVRYVSNSSNSLRRSNLLAPGTHGEEVAENPDLLLSGDQLPAHGPPLGYILKHQQTPREPSLPESQG